MDLAGLPPRPGGRDRPTAGDRDPRGSTAFANPTATMLRDPEGHDAVMVTMFVPMEGAAPGEAVSLLYLVPLDRDPAATPGPSDPQ